MENPTSEEGLFPYSIPYSLSYTYKKTSLEAWKDSESKGDLWTQMLA